MRASIPPRRYATHIESVSSSSLLEERCDDSMEDVIEIDYRVNNDGRIITYKIGLCCILSNKGSLP